MHSTSDVITPRQLSREIKKLVMDAEPMNGLGFHKKFKKIFKKVTKVVKKVAPIAAAGAAVWYGGPYVVSAAKGLFGSTPAVQPGGGGQAPITSPTVTDAATAQATQMAAAQGVSLNSPAAQNMLSGYIKYQQQRIQSKANQQAPLMLSPQARANYNQGQFIQQPFSPGGFSSGGYPPPAAKSALPGWAIPVGAAAVGLPLLFMAMK